MSTTYFDKLNAISFKDQLKQKLGLNYVSWASAYAELMKVDPYADYEILEDIPKKVVDGVETVGEPRPYFIIGNSAVVRTRIRLHGKRVYEYLGIEDTPPEIIEREMWLPIMNQKNAAVAIENMSSLEWNKAVWRCLVKNIAMFGLGLHVYDGEEFSDVDLAIQKLQTSCFELVQKKCKIGEAQTKKVKEICKEILGENPDPRQCEEKETLEALKKKLLAVR